jgi:uncharacterized protein DUF7002
LVTKDELAEVLADCPTLYHMAEQGSWPSIRKFGLMSTTALLDHYEVAGATRVAIEGERRPTSVSLGSKGHGRAVVRDQFPMDDKGLTRCLEDGLSPEDWYRTLNAKVFFWLTKERLLRLLNAGTYRNQEHDVLMLDTKSLIEANVDKIWLCPINSGCTKPFPHPRGRKTFQRVRQYPYAEWKTKRKRGERIVELAVDYAVPNIEKYVTRVVRMKNFADLAVLFPG